MPDKPLPPGLYEQLVSSELLEQLAAFDPRVQFLSRLDAEDAPERLSRYAAGLLERLLRHRAGDSLESQVGVVNAALAAAAGVVEAGLTGKELAAGQPQQLDELLPSPIAARLSRPVTPLSVSSLLTGVSTDPGLASEFEKETASADRIDILCSFIRWSGIALLRDALREFAARSGVRLRVITSAYMGVTQLRALEFLADLPNTEVRVSYDGGRTRVHAKAYLFERESGFTTCYVGSSNFTNPALTEGLEWNVKVTQIDLPHVVAKFRSSFDTLWNDDDFEPLDRERMREALHAARSDEVPTELPISLQARPWPFQEEILEKLQAEREIHGRRRNLVVAATGTGKTVIAAFDYERFSAARRGSLSRLLFVAHREEILKQSLSTFRQVLRLPAFGDLLVGGRSPRSYDHLFVSIQSLNSRALTADLPADFYEYIVVDEFHHAAAPRYQDLLTHFRPRILLGLTATPERSDELNVFEYFDGHIAAELRLPDALARKLLVPFHYFGINDETVDFRAVAWKRGRYDDATLESLVVNNRNRAALIVASIRDRVPDPKEMRALVFCVSVRHAQHMAAVLSEAGIPAAALHAGTRRVERDRVGLDLRRKAINAVCVVDLFNEGVDIPEVDTVVFLRPTESPTVFLQQLGRGLRQARDKDCLTVLDFVGRANERFSYESRFRHLLGRRGISVKEQVERGFPLAPPGCAILLDSVAAEHVLENLRAAWRASRKQLEATVRGMAADKGRPPAFREFLEEYEADPGDVYRRNTSWGRLLVACELRSDFDDPDERRLTAGLRRLAHIDDRKRIDFYLRRLGGQQLELGSALEERWWLMLSLSLWGDSGLPASAAEAHARLHRNPAMESELIELLEIRQAAIDFVDRPLDTPATNALALHCHYTRDEVLGALGHWSWGRRPRMSEGVLYLRPADTDLLFVTLDKADTDYSPTTMYRDYAINRELFHWESQSTTSDGSPTAERYYSRRVDDGRTLLFVRERKREEGLASPYAFLGPVGHASHRGSWPVEIVWRMAHPIPARLLRESRRLALG